LVLTDPILGLVLPGVLWAMGLRTPRPALNPLPPGGGGWPRSGRLRGMHPSGALDTILALISLTPTLPRQGGGGGFDSTSARGEWEGHAAKGAGVRRLKPDLSCWPNLATMLFTAAVVLAPWTIRNALVHREFVFVKSTFGYAFWQGNCALSEGTDKVVRA